MHACVYMCFIYIPFLVFFIYKYTYVDTIYIIVSTYVFIYILHILHVLYWLYIDIYRHIFQI